MKTQLAIICCALSSSLQANITQLPQGNQIYQQPEYPARIHFFDECRVIPWTDPGGQLHTEKGWVSLYGLLNGGTLFDTDLVALDPSPMANLWWNFEDSGFSLRYIVVNDGQDNCKLYRLRGINDPFSGNLSLTGFNNVNIQTIDLYGRIPGQVPDNDATIVLLFLGWLCLMAMNNREAR